MLENQSSIKRLVILGSTGSIGQQTLDIVRAFPQKFQVLGLAGGQNLELLKKQTEEFQPRLIYYKSGRKNAAFQGLPIYFNGRDGNPPGRGHRGRRYFR